MYTIFVRNWYKQERKPNVFGKGFTISLVPHPRARRTVIGAAKTQGEAREMCRQYNSSHSPGKLSRKAEYTSDY